MIIIKKLICWLTAFLLLCGCQPQKVQNNLSEPFIGVWISCYELDKMLNGGNLKEEFIGACDNLKSAGVTDAFLHVRAFGDSLFPSEYYLQKDNTLMYRFDVLEYMIGALKSAGVRAHAWINPFRTAPNVFSDPGDPNVRATVLCGVREIIKNYDVAGIHFDDYFYPADNDTIDNISFSEYKKAAKSPLERDDWRRANISALIFSVKDLIKESGKNIIFSISPAADIDKNINTYFADVKSWCKEGAADMIIPQLYFGFEYPDKKFCFDKLLKDWKKLTESGNTKLIIGLPAYKLGTAESPDSTEWQNGEDILAKQTKLCLGDSAVSGICFFSYSYLFSSTPLNTEARKKIIKEIKEIV